MNDAANIALHDTGVVGSGEAGHLSRIVLAAALKSIPLVCTSRATTPALCVQDRATEPLVHAGRVAGSGGA